jgi:hypothetical protein
MTTETEFEFDLIFALPSGAGDEGAMLDALFAAGCDDASVGVGAPGLVGLSFTRSGKDAEAVIAAAMGQVASAMPKGAVLREVRPDLVSLAEVAARLHVSRQALQKRDMPLPSLGGLYRAAEMLPFLEVQPGKVKDALMSAKGWFAAAAGAQRINARLSLDDSGLTIKRA